MCGPSGLGGLQHLGGHLVEGLGVPEPGLAGQTGLIRAIGAGGGAVALEVGGYVQRSDDSADFGVGKDDRVCVRAGWSWLGARGRRGGLEIGAVGGVPGVFVDVGEIEDRAERLAGMLVVVALVAVA